jgi:hypothetical protein
MHPGDFPLWDLHFARGCTILLVNYGLFNRWALLADLKLSRVAAPEAPTLKDVIGHEIVVEHYALDISLEVHHAHLLSFCLCGTCLLLLLLLQFLCQALKLKKTVSKEARLTIRSSVFKYSVSSMRPGSLAISEM